MKLRRHTPLSTNELIQLLGRSLEKKKYNLEDSFSLLKVLQSGDLLYLP
jgi:hypothetical protein